jgi:catechol 2,3-dioxygenase-like lactoylglutathione lyase family enzyme
MLKDCEIHVNIPARDLKRARRFYTEALGLEPSAEDDMTLTFPTPGGSSFQIYETTYAGTALHTIAAWDVPDIEEAVDTLRAKGVVFEEFEMPGIDWKDGIASIPIGRAAWFKDSEGNVMCLDEKAKS